MTHRLTGQRFGKLLVIESRGLNSRNSVMWLCHCDCGGSKLVDSSSLVSGKIRACGCTRGNPTHGHTRGGILSPTFSSWRSMIARCTQPSKPAFSYYRSNNITVCDEWKSFENFLADMGVRPSLDHSIDRHPNKMGNYEPGNCRWATKQEQANNRITNRLFTYRGREITFAELVRETGMSKDLLRHRICRAGWSLEDATNMPHQPGRRRDLGF